jgi:hypothetical protein
MRRIVGGVTRTILACGVSLALLAGCASQKVSLSTGPREYVASDYTQVLKRWTREADLINIGDLDTKLVVTATFESWDFRWAYVVRYAADYRLTVEQRRELLDTATKETTTSHDFYVALYGSTRRWTDLSKPDRSAWIVRLIDDVGDETAPSKIEPILRPGAIEYRYFPYTNVWRQVFRIKFPRTTYDGRNTIAPGARWFGLRFAGAEGNTELRWDLESGEEPRNAATVTASAAGEDLE